MLLDWQRVVAISDKHHLAITIRPDGGLVGDKRELARLYRLYQLEVEFEQYKGAKLTKETQNGTNERKSKG